MSKSDVCRCARACVCVRSATEDVGGAGWSFSKRLLRENRVFCLDAQRGGDERVSYSNYREEKKVVNLFGRQLLS